MTLRAAALTAAVLAVPVGAQAETLAELVRREEGVAFGPCALVPPPRIPGTTVQAVVPARFDAPGLWTTRTLLLVGIDAAGQVAGVAELPMSRGVSPREVIAVRCRERRVIIESRGETAVFRWDGQTLTSMSRGRRSGDGAQRKRPDLAIRP